MSKTSFITSHASAPYEEFHSKGRCHIDYHPDTLYKMIGSSYEIAFHDSEMLK